jgi:hypothetical protein
MHDEDYQPENYLSYLGSFIEQKDLSPIKSIILIWIFYIIDQEESIEMLDIRMKNYNYILTKYNNDDIFYNVNLDKKMKNHIYNFQIVNDDNKIFIKNSYYGDNFYIIYEFFKNVIKSPLLHNIYLSIEGYDTIIKNYDFSDITDEKIFAFPMFLTGKDYGLTQIYCDIVLINISPVNYYFKDVVSKIHNCFFLYVTILHEQGFHYIRLIFNKLNPDIEINTPKNLFLNLTKNPAKLELLNDDDDADGGNKGEIIIFGNDNLNLKQIFYFSCISNYSKSLSDIENDVNSLKNSELIITEKEIENSFFKDILTNDEKNDLIKGNFDKKKAKKLSIKCKKSKGFNLPFSYGKKDKI